MPGSVFRSGGIIGNTGNTYGPASAYASGITMKNNSLSEVEFFSRKYHWPNFGDATLLDDAQYYWNAANLYSYPPTGGSIWYDTAAGGSYLNKNNGTFAGNASYNSDSGGSIYCDGTGDWITDFPYALSNATTRTIGLFYKTTSSAFQTLIANRVASDNGWAIIINATASIGVRIAHYTPTTDYTLDYAGIPSTNTWYHLTYTYDRALSDAYLYVNGSQVASDLTFSNDTSSAFNGVIGAGTSTYQFPFTGYIGLVYIDDTVFNSTKIINIHNLFRLRFGI